MPARRYPGSKPLILKPGRAITRKYEVVDKLGEGWEGEVYGIRERNTGIERAAKLFYPQRNPRNKTARTYACKLHRLRHCPIIIQYHTEETIQYRGIPITVLVSEFVEGELLSGFLKKQRGGRLSPFQAIHRCMHWPWACEAIHHLGEYHGDLHADNVIVSRYGLGFELKLLDMFHWSFPKRENIQGDVLDMIRLFYDALGGQRHYSKQPDAVKRICCGLKRSLILKRFRSSSHLREHLETMAWD
ncbi:MAG: protein kinase [Gammaproteobacteria bacterium]|nr:protein kinase [Gammaproteobacteria bacterium]